MNNWLFFDIPKKPIPTEDVVCTGGSSSPGCPDESGCSTSRHTNPVSPDDPDKELCHECLEKHVLKLEGNLMDAIEQLMRYRRAAA